MLYVPADFAAYEHGTKYCPDCDFEFPEPATRSSVYGGGEAGDYNETDGGYGYVDKNTGMPLVIGMDKQEGAETIYVSLFYTILTS